MKISLSLAKKIAKLVEEKSINNSEFKNSKTLKELIEYGIVHLQVKGQKTKILLLSLSKLELYLFKIYGIKSLEDFLNEAENPLKSRARISQVSSDTKMLKTDVQAGMYLASYETVDIEINAEIYSLYTPNMSTFFLHKNAKLKLSKDILVVGVENFENVSSIALQAYLFNDSRKKVFIYRNKYFREFLSRSFNDYLHFGDFDLAGLNIYLNEVVPRLTHERHKFFIPDNISELLDSGNAEDYFLHLKKFPNLSSKSKYLEDFISLLHEKKRSLHQEFLIKHKEKS